MIKICDGMLMSFQGSTLCHAMTIWQNSRTGELCPPGDVFGIHFGLSMPTLTAMHCLYKNWPIHSTNVCNSKNCQM